MIDEGMDVRFEEDDDVGIANEEGIGKLQNSYELQCNLHVFFPISMLKVITFGIPFHKFVPSIRNYKFLPLSCQV